MECSCVVVVVVLWSVVECRGVSWSVVECSCVVVVVVVV